MEREIKTEQGDWGSLVFTRNVWKHSTPKDSDWNMITENRVSSGGFETPYNCSQNSSEIVCPYCESASEPEESGDWDSGERYCHDCEKDFYVEADFGYGFTTSPKECKHHDYVFGRQYAYFTDGRWTTWRIMECKNCENHLSHLLPKRAYEKINGRYEYVYDNQPLFTLLPWLDEYNDPDFFEPEGVLKTGADLTEEYETPILDFLRKGYWGKSYGINNPVHAIKRHEKIYGDL